MKILSAFSTKRKASTCVGSPEYTESIVRFSPDGNLFLEQGAKRNRQNEINSYKDSCDVNMMIRRYENGDQLALLRDNTGAYADLSTLPKNIHEADKLQKRINSLYDSMGDDIKAKYGSVDDFICAFSTADKFKEFCGFASDVVKQRAEKAKSKAKKEDVANA